MEADSLCAAAVQLGESQLLQAVTKMGDGVEETEARPVPHQLRHKYAKVLPGPPAL